jgi:hypothetical protein
MLYGCGCGVVDNSNHLTNFVEMRLFWLPLSIMNVAEHPSPTNASEKGAYLPPSLLVSLDGSWR